MGIVYLLLALRNKLTNLALEVNAMAVNQAERTYYKNIKTIHKLNKLVEGYKNDNEKLYVYLSENRRDVNNE